MSNVTQFPPRFPVTHQHGGGSGGDGVEARIAKLEATVDHIDRQLTDIKADVRELRLGGMAAVVLVFGAMTFGYFRLADRTEDVNKTLTSVQVTLERLVTLSEKKGP